LGLRPTSAQADARRGTTLTQVAFWACGQRSACADQGRVGGARWRRTLAARVGGARWRRTLAAHVGGARWRRALAARVGGARWRRPTPGVVAPKKADFNRRKGLHRIDAQKRPISIGLKNINSL